MSTCKKIVVSLLLTLQFLGAADQLLPKMDITPIQAGVRIHLDFQHVSVDLWQSMLEDPELFTKYGYGLAGAPGDPALPMTTQMIPINSAHDMSIGAIQRQNEVLQNIRLKTVPQGHLDSDPPLVTTTLYNGSQSSSSLHETLMLGDPVVMRGRQFLPVTLHPVDFDPRTHDVQVPLIIEFELLGVQVGDDLESFVQNGMRSILPPTGQFPRKGHYLIITPPLYEPYLQLLTVWKQRAGFEVTVVTTSVTGTSRTAIKNYIQTAWETWESRPDYLLLIGDSDQGMPGFYIQNTWGDNLIGDHPYTLLEGDDTFPELMVGRLSIDTISELITFTSKIVRYESTPPNDQPAWFERALMISTTLGAASAQATKEWVADKLIANGYSQIYSAYAPEVSSPSAISTPINLGVGFVNYRGFGYYTGWAGPDFTSGDIRGSIYNGGKTPIITSVVCGGGNFAAIDDPCFGEVWTRIGTATVPRGAVAFFGPSELYTHTQFNNVIDIGIYSAIFDGGVQTLGEALWAGKYELWRNYHQNTYFPFEQTAEFYHHIYNLLGDPGMQMWTAIPQLLNVVHEDTLSSGQNSVEIMVYGEDGSPISQAYVSLLGTNNTIGNYSDVSGRVSLPVDLAEVDEMKLTVTGKNLYPYLVTLPVQDGPESLAMESWTMNPDTLLVAGQSAPMELHFYNYGEAMNNVEFSFSSETTGISLSNQVVLASIPANSALDPIIIRLTADPELKHGTTSIIQLEVVGGSETWNWQKHVVVQAPEVDIHDFLLLSGSVNAGDSAQFAIELINRGGASSSPLSITPLDHALLSFSGAPLTCPELDIDGIGETENALDVVFSDQIFPGESLTVQFECSTPTRTDTLEATVSIGDVIRFGPSQTDDYGYRMFDEFDLSFSKAQSYDWMEINPSLGGSGSMIGITDNFEEADASTVIPLPFPVTYYGEVYTNMTVCSNGWAAFGAHSVVDFHNRIIPSPIGPPAMLAPFWDDLVTGAGGVYQSTNGDDGQFIVEWSQVNHLYMQDRLAFELIIFNTDLYPTDSGDNDIKFQYNLYENTDVLANFATIGIESPDSRSGLLATYNNVNDPSVAYLRNNTSILFSTDRGVRNHDARVSLSTTDIHFQQNPWSSATDSIIITNTGETPVAFAITPVEDSNRMIQYNPVVFDPSISKETADPPPESRVLRDGADAYGHYWQWDTDMEGPIFTWYDIETPGNLLAWMGDPDDSSIGPLSVGFEFPFYDDIYEELFIGSNGTISFESSFSPWMNSVLPNQMSPPAMIAPWWDDLNNDQDPNGSIYFWTNNNDQCIITWKDFPKWGTTQYYTFQVILHKIGMIKIQYQSMDESTSSGTIGMQNGERNIGLTIHHNETTPLMSGSALAVLRPVEWFSASNWSGRVDPGESEAFIVDVSAIGLPQGHYEFPMRIETSAPNFPSAIITVSMDIAAGELPWGDVNQDYQVNLNDAIRLVEYVIVHEEMTPEQFSRFDLSEDEHVDVVDIILLIEAILSAP
ncbi:MAG: hypothetical protein ISR87_10450 [Candidatus Marinimicrobia bacterium]|nr:hypothetical protein [FCB group bacterium]MBL7025865.1 hypothetical protein [Candidatus Neomarinimicrobiota bacterium]